MTKKSITDAAIKAAVKKNPSATHDQLATILGTSQSTVTRRLKALGYERSRAGRLVQINGEGSAPYDAKRYSAAASFVESYELIWPTLVIKTSESAAQVVCALIDAMRLPWVVGTIAGHDTVLVLFRHDPEQVEQRFVPLLLERLTEGR